MFVEDKVRLSTSIELAKYVSSTREIWDNYDSDKSDNDNVTVKVNKNDYNENIEGSPDNLYELYSIYN